jgi:hypothetical protein
LKAWSIDEQKTTISHRVIDYRRCTEFLRKNASMTILLSELEVKNVFNNGQMKLAGGKNANLC